MRILITGATGYIGSNLTLSLLEEDSVTKIIASGRSCRKSTLLEDKVVNQEKFEFIQGDLTNERFLEELHEKEIDRIVHLAAARGLHYCTKNPKKAVDVNIGGTDKLINLARHKKVSSFIYVSTRSVYGNREGEVVSELTPPSPRGIYGLTKYGAEVLTRYLGNGSGSYIILRPSQVYGLGLFMRENELLGKFTEQSLNAGNITVYGDGSQLVDLIHIRDLCNLIEKTVLSSDGQIKNQVFNVGGGEHPSINDLASIFEEAFNDFAFKETNRRYLGEVNSGDSQTLLDINKVKGTFDWEPTISLYQGVKELLKDAMGMQ